VKLLSIFSRPVAPNPGRALAQMGVAKRADANRTDKARFRAMAREICAATNQPVPAILEG